MANKNHTDNLTETINRRADLTERLMNSLAHLPHPVQISIITSWINLDDLQEIVEFQEKR